MRLYRLWDPNKTLISKNDTESPPVRCFFRQHKRNALAAFQTQSISLSIKKNIRSNITEHYQYRTPTVTMRAQPVEFPKLKSYVNIWWRETLAPGSVCEVYYTWECQSLSPPLGLSLCACSGRGLSVFNLSTVPNLRTAATWGPGTTDVGWNNYKKNRDLDRMYNIQGWKLMQHCEGLKTQQTFNSILSQ